MAQMIFTLVLVDHGRSGEGWVPCHATAQLVSPSQSIEVILYPFDTRNPQLPSCHHS